MRCAAAPWPRRGNKSSLGLWLEGAPWCCAYGSSCARIRHCLAAARYCSSVNQEPEHQTGLLPDGLSPDERYRAAPCLSLCQYKYIIEMEEVLEWDEIAFRSIETQPVSTYGRLVGPGGACKRGYMLYDTYQAHSDVLAPIRLTAEFFRGVLIQ